MRKITVWAAVTLFVAAVFSGTPGALWAQAQGKQIYTDKCSPCHGDRGDGKGPMAVTYNPPPGNFNDPKFWQGDVNKKIETSVKNGKGQMIPVDLNDAQIKAVIDYMSHTFKK